jgi:hypothetical protein
MTGELARQFKQVFVDHGLDDFERPSEADVADLLDDDLDDDADEDDNLFPDADDRD